MSRVCPSCMRPAREPDDEFCVYCGTYYGSVPGAGGLPEPPREELLRRGGSEMESGNFSEGLLNARRALSGAAVSDDEYREILESAVSSILSSVDSKGTFTRVGIAETASRLDGRDFVGDLMAGVLKGSEDLTEQRQMLNLANEYLSLVLESFRVQTDIRRLCDIAIHASEAIEDLREMSLGLKPMEGRPADWAPAYMRRQSDFCRELYAVMFSSIRTMDPSAIDTVSSRWQTSAARPFAENVRAAYGLHLKMCETGSLKSAMCRRARDEQLRLAVRSYFSEEV